VISSAQTIFGRLYFGYITGVSLTLKKKLNSITNLKQNYLN